jgi:hypothetical protein
MEVSASNNNNEFTTPAATEYNLSSGNTVAFSNVTPAGYTITVTNASIVGATKSCTVSVGAAATAATDGKISCGGAAAP